jgi:hypothetical protein
MGPPQHFRIPQIAGFQTAGPPDVSPGKVRFGQGQQGDAMLTATRPFVPPLPFRPHVVQEHDDDYLVPAVALVKSQPHRRRTCARRLAQAIASNPGGYLSVCIGFKVPGVYDLRPTFTRRGQL